MSRYQLTKQALQDLHDIGNYIARDNKQAAIDLLTRLHQRCISLAEHPGAGRKRTELAENVRSMTEGNYVIFYQAYRRGEIKILRIVHAKRDLGKIIYLE